MVRPAGRTVARLSEGMSVEERAECVGEIGDILQLEKVGGAAAGRPPHSAPGPAGVRALRWTRATPRRCGRREHSGSAGSTWRASRGRSPTVRPTALPRRTTCPRLVQPVHGRLRGGLDRRERGRPVHTCQEGVDGRGFVAGQVGGEGWLHECSVRAAVPLVCSPDIAVRLRPALSGVP